MIVNPTEIMSKREVATVLADLHRRAKRSRLRHQALIIFRLTIGAGLRAREVAGLELRDVRLAGDRPHLKLRETVAKGGKPRTVPLWWDVGTLEALAEWKRVRTEMGARANDPFVCVLSDRLVSESPLIRRRVERSHVGAPLTRVTVGRKWKSAIRCLGRERQQQLHTHSGRHTFACHMLADGRSLAEVRDAMGHANVATTNQYLHVRPEDLDRKGDVYTIEPA